MNLIKHQIVFHKKNPVTRNYVKHVRVVQIRTKILEFHIRIFWNWLFDPVVSNRYRYRKY